MNTALFLCTTTTTITTIALLCSAYTIVHMLGDVRVEQVPDTGPQQHALQGGPELLHTTPHTWILSTG